MRPLTLEEREDLMLTAQRGDCLDPLDFADSVRLLAAEHGMDCLAVLGVLRSCPPRPYDLEDESAKGTARRAHDEGVEVTPDQVRETLAEVLDKARCHLRSLGRPVPRDEELLEQLREACLRRV